nr:PREDICTED: uncharacterized protein LOC109042917 [Bemisia tabaci]
MFSLIQKLFYVCPHVSAQKLLLSCERKSLRASCKSLIHLSGKSYSSKTSDLENCNVGTVGHVDHGKTTLTSALTKYASKKGLANYVAYDQIDQAPAEKARGITINIAHVGYRTEKRLYSHTDCPGHADFVKNMISGASQMDGAIVVVAATDGQMPQTKEHLFLCKQIGVLDLIVFINKADLVDSDMLELVELEMGELLVEFGFSDKTPMIRGSALRALEEDTSELGEPSIQKLLDTMDNYFKVPERKVDAPFLMPIDNALLVPGRGAVLIGTILQGNIKKNEPLLLVGFGETLSTTFSDIQVFKQSVNSAAAGDHIGALCRGIKAKNVKKGMTLCKEKSGLPITNVYHASLYLLTEKEGGRTKPIKCKFAANIFCHTWNCHARIDFPPEKEFLMPGDYATVRLTLMYNMIMPVGTTFAFRERGCTVATGKITKTLDPVHVPKLNLGNLKISVEASEF